MRVLFVAALCISLMFYADTTLAESDEICCNWVNTRYVSGNRPQKLIFNDDGTFATYQAKLLQIKGNNKGGEDEEDCLFAHNNHHNPQLTL